MTPEGPINKRCGMVLLSTLPESRFEWTMAKCNGAIIALNPEHKPHVIHPDGQVAELDISS